MKKELSASQNDEKHLSRLNLQKSHWMKNKECGVCDRFCKKYIKTGSGASIVILIFSNTEDDSDQKPYISRMHKAEHEKYQ